MVSRVRFSKEKQYPLPHDYRIGYIGLMDGATDQCTTIIPNLAYTEAMIPDAKFTNPEHTSFAEDGSPMVCPDSEIFSISTMFRLSYNNQGWETDKIPAFRIGFIPIHLAFKEDLTAIDEKTSVEVQDVLELQSESTNRSTYPLFNGTKLIERNATQGTYDAKVLGLTTTQVLEHVAFDPDLYYDAIKYYTISGKLRKVQDGLRWITLTQDNPTRVITLRQKFNTKRANPYMFNGVLIYMPASGSEYQIPNDGETTAIKHLNVQYHNRFLEWNHSFNFDRVTT